MNDIFLDASAVRRARAEEMEFFKKLGVYKRVPRSRFAELNGKMISVKWLDTNKGDRLNPNHRSRLVVREFNQGKDDTLYASTPPLEAMRLIVSHAATIDPENPNVRRDLMVNDVRRAYFYAQQKRNVFIELPSEDGEALPGEVGQLMLCLYGTRDAAREWQRTLSEHLVPIGFEPGRGHSSIFAHHTKGIRLLVHGDDYFSSGPTDELDWLETELENRYEIQSQRFHGNNKEQQELKILNRIVRRTMDGFEVEADPRHVELVLVKMQLDKAQSLSTMGVDVKEEDDRPEELPLDPERAKMYRSTVARLNYLSSDRPDIQYSTKEACRDMASPSEGSWRRLERICRYLKGRPRLLWNFKMQHESSVVDVFSDANWAGYRRVRKSTSGGAMVVGTHLIKTYSKTQATIAKSSAESELYGIVRATCEGLGMITLLEDFGAEYSVRLHMDATAAQGVIDRQGISKIRHLDVNVLWLQEQLAWEKAPITKVLGTENVANLMTKNVEHPLDVEALRQAVPGVPRWASLQGIRIALIGPRGATRQGPRAHACSMREVRRW